MILFILFIAFIEAFLFSYFLACFYDIHDRKHYLVLSATLQCLLYFFSIMIYFDGLGLIFSITVIMLICLSYWNEHVSYDYLYMIILFESCMILILPISSLISVYFNLTFYLRMILNLIFQIILTVILLKKKNDLGNTFNQKSSSSIIIYDTLNIIVIIILLISAIQKEPDSFTHILLLFLSICLALFFRYIVNEINVLYQKEIDYIQMQNIAKQNHEKLLMIKRLKYDIDASSHRLSYILYQIENDLKDKNYEDIQQLLNIYKDTSAKQKMIIDTGNPIFDCLYSMKINDIILKGKDIENSISITQNNLYNQMSFINFLNDLFAYFEDCRTLIITIQEKSSFLYIGIIYRDGQIDCQNIDNFFRNKLKDNGTWNLENSEIKGVRFTIDLEKNDSFI